LDEKRSIHPSEQRKWVKKRLLGGPWDYAMVALELAGRQQATVTDLDRHYEEALALATAQVRTSGKGRPPYYLSRHASSQRYLVRRRP
jgi:hypothetical protein